MEFGIPCGGESVATPDAGAKISFVEYDILSYVQQLTRQVNTLTPI